MAEVINMPRLSDTMEEGVVAKWLKQKGDKVEEGDILAELDKNVYELTVKQREGELSEARANAVRSFLVGKGINSSRIKAIGYGETRPIADNETPEGRQKNRRTQVRILSQ